MSLQIEVYANEKWNRAGVIGPGDPSGSMSDNKPDGKRELYLFECSLDGSESVIYRSRSGIDTEIMAGQLRKSVIANGLETVKVLRRGDEPYVIEVQTDKSPEPRQIRFTHM